MGIGNWLEAEKLGDRYWFGGDRTAITVKFLPY